MKTVQIDYWTDAMTCCGQNVGGFVSLELEEKDVEAIQNVLEPARKSGDFLTYIKENLPQELFTRLYDEIQYDFYGDMAEDIIYKMGYEALEDEMSEEEFEEASMSDLVERMMDGDGTNMEDIGVVDLEIRC